MSQDNHSFSIHDAGSDLLRIDLPLKLIGFNTFISAWVHTRPPVCLIDMGPAATASVLLRALSHLGIHQLDALLVTHIHMDHAGALGHVAEAFPGVTIYCHPAAHPHLVDPTKLYAGTVKVLKDLGRAYGPMRPVPASRLRDALAESPQGVEVLATPGHALHHLCFGIQGRWFIGEAAGVCLPMADGSYFVRPATPPVFVFDVFRDSLQALRDLNPQLLCYGHLGGVAPEAQTLVRHHRQLGLWQSCLLPHRTGSVNQAAIPVDDLLATLMDKDPELQGLYKLPTQVRLRETYFLKNSIRGFLTQKP